MQVFYQPDLPHTLQLPEEEAKHCQRVLRHQPGDIIHVTDGHGSLYTARLTGEQPKRCSFEIVEQLRIAEEKPYAIHIAIAPTKNSERLEWFLEKAMEFGIDEISLLQCRHSERSKINMDRLEKKAISAMKQSLNLRMPRIHPLLKLEDFIRNSEASKSQRFIAYVDETIPQHLKEAAKAGAPACVLIGPEGDFAAEEITAAREAGFIPVSLGKSRLRTETAGIAACHILNLLNE
ncbi:16S rRNA (uracil(1498)-N(3))-methyltransferase [Nafulsella turpanensis]|uniref:16S rRNA (uracil(1498)-N(3))-methyltransferase n=1 Tax=Nafulsella turpanensis TaxID=1265690 RepID=UPI00034C74C7|nr:16S rRNA (uracil(1498)-N(3))-methyltransferase [Nafulsella turpanensis]